MKIIHQILKEAEPLGKDLKVEDVVVGISLVAILLSNKSIGVSYVLRDNLPHGCSAFHHIEGIIDQPANNISKWALEGKDNLSRSIGIAVLTAIASSQTLPLEKPSPLPLNITLTGRETVGMVGYIPMIASPLMKQTKDFIVFDEGLDQEEGNAFVVPKEKQSILLPTCDLVLFSGTSTVNQTVDDLLNWSQNSKEVIMVGASSPMFPRAFSTTSLTKIAGSSWNPFAKEEIFTAISRGGGIGSIRKYMNKHLVPVPH